MVAWLRGSPAKGSLWQCYIFKELFNGGLVVRSHRRTVAFGIVVLEELFNGRLVVRSHRRRVASGNACFFTYRSPSMVAWQCGATGEG